MILGRGSLLMYACKHQPDELPKGTLVLLENTAQKQHKGVNCAQHGLDHTPSARTWAKGCTNSKAQLGTLCERR